MRRTILIIAALALLFGLAGCTDKADAQDRLAMNAQQEHYAEVQPLPVFEYSIPRDILIQIYKVVTEEANSTYTIIESVTGETRYHGPSLGYGIAADTQLTNPLKRGSNEYAIEQAEPNGLYSSKNTDGTWILFVDNGGDITPVYTEHKVTTFPFTVVQTEDGWVRAGNEAASYTIEVP